MALKGKVIASIATVLLGGGLFANQVVNTEADKKAEQTELAQKNDTAKEKAKQDLIEKELKDKEMADQVELAKQEAAEKALRAKEEADKKALEVEEKLKATSEHTVGTGESLQSIAAIYEKSAEQVFANNEGTLENPNLVTVGMVLNVGGDNFDTTKSKSLEMPKPVAVKEEVIEHVSQTENVQLAVAPTSVGTPQGKTITVQATAYSVSEPGMGTVTANGTHITPSSKVIAVDPNQIPLGTRVHVEGYGEAIAADTGGAIGHGIIDVHMPSVQDCLNWGRRTVTVTILD